MPSTTANETTLLARLGRRGVSWISAALIALGGISACTLFYDADPGEAPSDAGARADSEGTGDGSGSDTSRQ